LLTLSLVLAMLMMVLVMNNTQLAQANAADEPVVTTEETYYLPLTDAPPQRDISQQRFAPLQ
jgi:hypothetical protein